MLKHFNLKKKLCKYVPKYNQNINLSLLKIEKLNNALQIIHSINPF